MCRQIAYSRQKKERKKSATAAPYLLRVMHCSHIHFPLRDYPSAGHLKVFNEKLVYQLWANPFPGRRASSVTHVGIEWSFPLTICVLVHILPNRKGFRETAISRCSCLSASRPFRTRLTKKLRRIAVNTFFFLTAPLNCHCDSRSVATTAAPRIDGCGGRLSTVDSIKAPLGSDSSFMARYIILLEASIRRWS